MHQYNLFSPLVLVNTDTDQTINLLRMNRSGMLQNIFLFALFSFSWFKQWPQKGAQVHVHAFRLLDSFFVTSVFEIKCIS